jgi:predicted transcriptional regulator
MQVFWKLKKAYVKDVIEQLPDDPKPPYNTISSVVRLLEKKGYLDHRTYGKTYEYFPVISKAAYRKMYLKKLMSGYFENSPASLMSFLVKEEKLSQEEIDKLRDIINKSS